MKKFQCIGGFVTAALLCGGVASAGSLANKDGVALSSESLVGVAHLTLNGTQLAVDVNPIFNKDGTINYVGTHVFGDGNRTTFSILANPDPSIVYGLIFGPTPGAGPNNYAFDFSQPFSGGNYNHISQDFSGSATFGGQGLGGNITNIVVRSDINGVYVNDVDLTGFSCSSAVNGSISCGEGSASAAVPLVSAPGTISVHFQATVSGPHDVGTFNGETELSSVPEPGSLILLGSGLLGLMFKRFRKIA